MTNLRTTLENALSDLDTAIERECLEDVAIVVAYMREALAKSDEPRPSHIKTWRERCDELHDDMVIVTSSMVRQRVHEEIDDLRAALNRPAGTQ